MMRRVGELTLAHNPATALEKYRRVTWDGTTFAYAGAAAVGHGTLRDEVIANNGQDYAVLVPNKIGGSRFVVCAGAVAKGAALVGAANGKVDDGAGTSVNMIALEAGSGDGSIIEALEV